MNNYIDTNNRIWGFDSTQTDLIPAGAVLIPSIYIPAQYPYLTLVNGVINYDSSAYDAALNSQELENCKSQAQSLLTATDWSEIPSVSDTANTPHLVNTSDFIAYRNALRVLAVNPVVNPTWPTKPMEQWS